MFYYLPCAAAFIVPCLTSGVFPGSYKKKKISNYYEVSFQKDRKQKKGKFSESKQKNTALGAQYFC